MVAPMSPTARRAEATLLVVGTPGKVQWWGCLDASQVPVAAPIVGVQGPKPATVAVRTVPGPAVGALIAGRARSRHDTAALSARMAAASTAAPMSPNRYIPAC